MLSLAGIPPLAGFVGKFVVFTGTLQMDGIASSAGWLAVLAIAMGAAALIVLFGVWPSLLLGLFQ